MDNNNKKIETVTLQQAIEWNHKIDQAVFICDEFDCRIDSILVDQIEDRMISLLQNEGIAINL